MKKIVILGSKPGAKWLDADVVYCANGAIGFYAQELSSARNIVNVVSARILNKSRLLQKKSNAEVYSSKLSAICGANPLKMILIGSISKPSLAIELAAWLKVIGYKSHIEFVDYAMRVSLLEKLTGLTYPVPLKAVFLQSSILIAVYDLIHLMLFRIGLKKGEVNRKYRPSTGIIALLIAIQEHGHDAEYFIAGIGLYQRNIHQINGKLKLVPSKRDSSGIEPHVLADRLIISALAQRYRLVSWEPSIDVLINKSAGNF